MALTPALRLALLGLSPLLGLAVVPAAQADMCEYQNECASGSPSASPQYKQPSASSAPRPATSSSPAPASYPSPTQTTAVPVRMTTYGSPAPSGQDVGSRASGTTTQPVMVRASGSPGPNSSHTFGGGQTAGAAPGPVGSSSGAVTAAAADPRSPSNRAGSETAGSAGTKSFGTVAGRSTRAAQAAGTGTHRSALLAGILVLVAGLGAAAVDQVRRTRF